MNYIREKIELYASGGDNNSIKLTFDLFYNKYLNNNPVIILFIYFYRLITKKFLKWEFYKFSKIKKNF